MEDARLDFAKYELDQLGQDVRSVVNVPGAIVQTAKYSFLFPVAVGIGTWLIFSSRMDGFLGPFVLIAVLLSLLSAMIIGGFFVARKRLDTVASASSRVVDVIGEMHSDVERVRDGHAETSVQQVAVGLLETAILPMVFGSLSTAAESAGPLGRIAAKVSKAPVGLVEKSVISAVKALPDHKIGDVAQRVGETLPDTEASLTKLRVEYASVRDKMESFVAKASSAATRSMLALAAIASIPLALWLLLGWVFT